MKQFGFVAAMAVLLCASSAMADEFGSIKGMATMADGKTPAAFVSLKVVDAASGEWVASARTDATGAFTVHALAMGTYKVLAADGTVALATVSAGQAGKLTTIKLKPDVRSQGMRRGGTNKKMMGVGMLGAFVAGCVVVVGVIILFG